MEQKHSKLFKLPSPILKDIFLTSLKSPNEIIELLSTCKKIYNFLYTDPRIWLSLLLSNFPKKIGPPEEIEKCKVNILNGFQDNSRDWRGILTKKYIKHRQITREINLKRLKIFFNNSDYKKILNFLSQAKLLFSLRSPLEKEPQVTKNVRRLGGSIILTINHKVPIASPSTVEMTIFGVKLLFIPSSNLIVKKANVNLCQTEFSLCVMTNSEIYTEYCFFSIYEVAAKLIKYKIPRIYGNISKNLGFQGYKIYVNLHNFKESLYCRYQRVVDFEAEKNAAFAWMNGIEHRILKDKFSVDWKNSEFSENISDIGVIDFIF